MPMIRPGVYFQLLAHLLSHLGLWKHSANRQFEDSLRMPREQLLGYDFLESARPAGVMTVDLLLEFVSGEPDLLRVDDYHVVTDVDERSISWLILSHQQSRRGSRKPPDGLAVGVNDEPLARLLQILPARDESLHDTNLQIVRKENEQTEYEMVMGLSRQSKPLNAPLEPRSRR